MKLNLGCSFNHRDGYVNVDIIRPADQLVNLESAWPWPESSCEAILAVDIIEHLSNKIQTMNEIWRVLAPGGVAEIEVPTTNGECAFADPTHVTFWNRRSFFYFEDGHEYQRLAVSYGIKARFKVIEEYTRTMRDGPKLLIKLEAVK